MAVLESPRIEIKRRAEIEEMDNGYVLRIWAYDEGKNKQLVFSKLAQVLKAVGTLFKTDMEKTDEESF